MATQFTPETIGNYFSPEEQQLIKGISFQGGTSVLGGGMTQYFTSGGRQYAVNVPGGGDYVENYKAFLNAIKTGTSNTPVAAPAVPIPTQTAGQPQAVSTVPSLVNQQNNNQSSFNPSSFQILPDTGFMRQPSQENERITINGKTYQISPDTGIKKPSNSNETITINGKTYTIVNSNSAKLSQQVPLQQQNLQAIPGETFAQYEARLGFPQSQGAANGPNQAPGATSGYTPSPAIPGQDFAAYEASQGFPQGGTQPAQGSQGAQGNQVAGSETQVDPLQPLKDLLSSYGITPNTAQAAANPLATFDDVYKKVYDQLGLGDMKNHIDDLTKRLAENDQKIADKISNINSNPWLSEGIRLKQIASATKGNQLERSNILNELKLNESYFEKGRQDARYAARETITQTNQNRNFDLKELEFRINLAEKALEAQERLGGKTVNPGKYGTLQYNPETGSYEPIVPPAKSNTTKGGSNLQSYLAKQGIPLTVASKSGQLNTSALNKAVSSGVPVDVALGIWENMKAGNDLETIRQGLASEFGRNQGFQYLDKFVSSLQPKAKTAAPAVIR